VEAAGEVMGYNAEGGFIMPTMKYTATECGKLGDALYESKIKPLVDIEGNDGRIVAIDVDSGDFEVDDESMRAAKALRERRPDAQIWCIRIGYPAVIFFGGIRRKAAE